MKVSRKQIAKWQQKDMKTQDGHVANNLELAGLKTAPPASGRAAGKGVSRVKKKDR